MYYSILKTRLTTVLMAGEGDAIEVIRLQPDMTPVLQGEASWQQNDGMFEDARKQIAAYLNGGLTHFSLKLKMNGTPFQQRVWQELQDIPYGSVVSYRAIADRLGIKNGARAVGTANAKNPLPIVVPCHRVIGANGKLTGYAYGVALKKKLLALEGVKIET